jgi:TatD DNase family protein
MARFAPDREDVIARAREAGFEALITIGSDFASNTQALALAEAHPDVYCSVGIHPHDARDFTEEIAGALAAWATHPKVVAIGETGLDYHYDNSPRDMQRDVFMRHLTLAGTTGLPAVIHSREADEATARILRDSGIQGGVLHCFSGSRELLETALSLGLCISVAGPVTFPKATGLKEMVKRIPDENLLLETDAPYLAPVPMRGKRNEPAYMVHTAREVARLRGLSLEDIARISTLNARRLFRIGNVSGNGEIAYKIRDSLYLNITNRCTNQCSFCVRSLTDYVKGHNLRLEREPTAEELEDAIGDPAAYAEVVFCGYGEPLLRLDLVKELSSWIKEHGGTVRINTNGQGNLIHRRNILPELKGKVDVLSVSMDAHDEDTYDRICRPALPHAFPAVLEFIRDAQGYIPDVQVTVVDAEGVNIEKCKDLAETLNVPLRVRRLHAVG